MKLNNLRHLLDAEDIRNVFKAIKEAGDIWGNELLKASKRKFKDNYRYNNEHCCYCRRHFGGEFNMVIDIEHILPKSKFKGLIFDEINLSVACKKCNMNVKKENCDFVDIMTIMSNYTTPSAYKIVHPNLDTYSCHITYTSIIVNDTKFIKYFIKKNTKGQYTYDYFKLNELEISSLNKAQGAADVNSDNESISSKIQDIINLIQNGI